MSEQVETEDLIRKLDPVEWMPVGSRVTCDPAPTDTDIDVLVRVKIRRPDAVAALGFDLDSSGKHYEPSEGQFNSWRRGNLNLIVTDDREFYDRFALATHLAKAFNLLEKRDRIALFQAVLYRRTWLPEAARSGSEDTQPKATNHHGEEHE